MKLLALDTSTEYCSIALWLDGAVLLRHELVGQRHSELALGMVDSLLAEAGATLDALHGIAFGMGPGSFTGLRIACGIAQGLALGAGLPVAGISTLLAVAEGSGQDKVLACLDARMGEVYCAGYERDGAGWRERLSPGLCAPADVPLPDGAGWAGCGSGFAQYGAALAARLEGRLDAVLPDVPPRADYIARLAEAEFARSGGMAAEEALPLYIRDKVALKTCERQ